MKRILASIIFVSTIQASGGLTLPPNNPSQGSGADYFDWQQEWGSIHMNTFSDGLLDPGTPVNGSGSIKCARGSICSDMQRNSVDPGAGSQQIDNGIKFDIKNSLLYCMSKALPNWAYLHGQGYSQSNVCTSALNMPELADEDDAYANPELRTMVYMPFYDPRSNDNSPETSGRVGCQQQITNNCGKIRDIHSCQGVQSDGEGYLHPVTHVFTPEEVADLGGRGRQLPTVYYRYKKIVSRGTRLMDQASYPSDNTTYEDLEKITYDCTPPVSPSSSPSASPTPTPIPQTCHKYNYTPITGSRFGLSRSANPNDKVPNTTVSTIKNESDPILSRLKAYRMVDEDPNEDKSTFVIVDPKDFYDLNLYKPGGKYDSNYTAKDGQGNPATPDTCPVLGLRNGYSGICDPTGKAGCNLPIYLSGTSTQFNTDDGSKFTYNDHPIKWSGYVIKWAVLTPNQYIQNIRNRKKSDGASMYLSGNSINANPVLMLTRADEYCDLDERKSKSNLKQPDMPCIHYLQYQKYNASTGSYGFVNLYNPDTKVDVKPKAELNTLVLYDIGSDGKPNISRPISGSGSNQYIGDGGTKTGYLSFKDQFAATIPTYLDSSKGQSFPAVMVSSGIKISDTEETVGEYLGNSPSNGVGIKIQPGTAKLIHMPYALAEDSGSRCTVVNYKPRNEEQPQVFIPTNSADEFKSFIAAAKTRDIGRIKLTSCGASFKVSDDNSPTSIGELRAVAKIGKSWYGNLSCDDLTDRPTCNSTALISAERYCVLENGSLDSCDSCKTAEDPDSQLVFSEASIGYGEILNDPKASSKNKCYFSAACFNKSDSGCPAANTSGGHVFCLAAETKIKMADGKDKDIIKIKAGEEVVAFDARFSRDSAMKKAKVKAVAITKNQKIIKINDLKITPKHKIVLSNGRSVMASDIKIGDQILLENGQIEEVKSIDKDLKPITVYNLVLEKGSDGYIANNMRVISYPKLKGM